MVHNMMGSSCVLFTGIIEEYPFFVVDNFNSRSTHYFLSHAHKDHLKGLTSVSWSCKVFCSPVTKQIISCISEYNNVVANLVEIPIGVPTALDSCDSESCGLPSEIILLPAGHSLGSAMLFLTGPRGNVLYTGDFRFSRDLNDKILKVHLKDISLDTLYVDTTFFHPAWRSIPTREFSSDVAISIIDNWIKSLNFPPIQQDCSVFRVWLCLRTNWVYEYFIESIAKRFQVKICVDEETYNKYLMLSDVNIVNYLCTDSSLTWIHICSQKKSKCAYHQFSLKAGTSTDSYNNATSPSNTNNNINAYNSLTILPTAIWFGLLDSKLYKSEYLSHIYLPTTNINHKIVRVFYGTHASEKEIIHMIELFKPKKAIACCVPPRDNLTNVQNRLNAVVMSVQMSLSHNATFTNREFVSRSDLPFKSNENMLLGSARLRELISFDRIQSNGATSALSNDECDEFIFDL